MITSNGSGPLTDRDWGHLNDRCEALERAWRKAEDDFVDLRRFLPPAEAPLRRRCLLELIKTELEIRWRRNLPITDVGLVEQFGQADAKTSFYP